MPEAQRRERRVIVNWLQSFPVQVKLLPAIEDFAAGRVTVNDLRAVDVEDLLGRDPVPPDPSLLSVNIADKSVMVTGAGGSIGSELSRQIARLRPTRLVLLDHSEAALYEIESEINEIIAQRPETEKPELVAVLGSVLDEKADAQGAGTPAGCNDLPCRSLQARPDRRGEPQRGIAQQYVRDARSRRSHARRVSSGSS